MSKEKSFNFTKLDLNPIEEQVERTETPEAKELIIGKEIKNNKVTKLISSRKEAMKEFGLSAPSASVNLHLDDDDKSDLGLILLKRKNITQKELAKEYILKGIREDMKRLGLKSLREE